MVKEIAARWRSLDAETKDRMEGMAKADLARYKKEVEVYEDDMVEKTRREREELAVQQEKQQKEEEKRAAAVAELQRDDALLAQEQIMLARQHQQLSLIHI